jgi:DNA-binding NarL/FixJ family response regulator
MMDNATVLIVDDHAVVRARVCELLQAVPHVRTIEAATGLEALEAIKTQAPGLALLDIGLPDMSGLELLKLIRAQGPKQPRAIMFSVRAELVYAAWTLRLGAWGVVSKAAGAQGLID